MKKNKSKSKHLSTSKKTRKELESKLAGAFNEVAIIYGQAKKTDKVIEKFAKQLSKKIKVAVSNDCIEPIVKEEEILVSSNEVVPVSTVKQLKGKKLVKA